MAFDPVSTIIDVGGRLIDKLFPDPKQKAEATLKLLELQQSGDLAVIAGQVAINKLEAESTSNFRGGWRPAVGWLCVFGIGMQAVVFPMIVGVAAILGRVLVLPTLDISVLMTILVGMLGLGGMRTVEKLQGLK